MKKPLITVALLLALGACSDDKSSSNPLTNIEAVSTTTTDDQTQQPTDAGTVIDPVTTPTVPVTTPTDPVTTPTEPGSTISFDISLMFNGTSEFDFQSFWKCVDVGETDPENFFSMRFYSDESGAFGGGGSIIEYSWAATDNSIDMAFPNDSRNFRFANISFLSLGILTTNFEITGVETSAQICELLDLNGNPVYLDDSSGQSPVPGGETPPIENGSSVEVNLSNGPSAAQATSWWLCEISIGTFGIAFYDDFNGQFIDGSDQVVVISPWFLGDSGDIQFVLGNLGSTIVSPQFSGSEAFTSSNLTLGNSVLGSMSCSRQSGNFN